MSLWWKILMGNRDKDIPVVVNFIGRTFSGAMPPNIIIKINSEEVFNNSNNTFVFDNFEKELKKGDTITCLSTDASQVPFGNVAFVWKETYYNFTNSPVDFPIDDNFINSKDYSLYFESTSM